MSSTPPPEQPDEKTIPILSIDGRDMVSISDARFVLRQETGYAYSYAHTQKVLSDHPEIPRTRVGATFYVPVDAVRAIAASLFPPTAETPERKPRRGRRQKSLAADQNTIRAQYQAGVSPAQIGREAGISRNTVHFFSKDVVEEVHGARQARIVQKRQVLAPQVLALHQQGWTLEQIAKKLKRSVAFVQRLLPEEERSTNHIFTEAEKADAIRRIESGETISVVAGGTGIPAQTLYVWTRPFFLAQRKGRPAQASASVKQEARDLREQGFRLKEIEEILKYDLSAISVWVADITPRYTLRQQREAMARVKAGEDPRLVADSMGIEFATIAYWSKLAQDA